MQKKKEKDTFEREAQAFGLNHKFAPSVPEGVEQADMAATANRGASGGTFYTIPQPFELSTGKEGNFQKRVGLEKELLKKEMKECTFVPATNEAKTKEIVQKMLREEERP